MQTVTVVVLQHWAYCRPRDRAIAIYLSEYRTVDQPDIWLIRVTAYTERQKKSCTSM